MEHINPHILRWFGSLVFTLALEIPVYIWIIRFSPSDAEKPTRLRAALVAALASLITHPMLWYSHSIIRCDYLTFVTVGETAVAIVESLVLILLCQPIKISRAVAASFIANSASLGGGILLRHLLPNVPI